MALKVKYIVVKKNINKGSTKIRNWLRNNKLLKGFKDNI